MELPFNVADRLGLTTSTGPCVGRVDKTCSAEVLDAIDALCQRSAILRGLKFEKPSQSMGLDYIQDIDNRLPGIRETDDIVYLLVEGSDILGLARIAVRPIMVRPPQAVGESAAGGYPAAAKIDSSKVGSSTGSYVAHTVSLQKITPCCLLDFFVAESLQHRGLGRLLLDAMMSSEALKHPSKIAYFHPSEAMFAFLAKHFTDVCGKAGKKVWTDGYLLFDKYFDEPQPASDVTEGKSPPDVSKADQVTTKVDGGEEGLVQEILYTHRAQLFCFNEGDWQNAGAGEVSVAKHNSSGKIRLTFVQDATQRVIANHLIINRAPFCDLQRHKAGNDKTWTWMADDPKGVNPEPRYAMKFKTSDDAATFKEVFEMAKSCSVENDAVEYVVVRKVGVTAKSEVNSQHVKLVTEGTIVSVVEVLYLSEAKQVRARLLKPEGWMTIMSHNASDAGSYAVMRSDLESYSQKAMPSRSAKPTWRCTTISRSPHQ